MINLFNIFKKKNSDIISVDISNIPYKDMTQNDIDRNKRVIGILKHNKIPYISRLRFAPVEADTKIRPVNEIIDRLLALVAVGLYSEAIAAGEKDV